MSLGAFSVSLNVQDIAASAKFYKALGFEQIGGDIEQNWVILRNGPSVLGLFHGMFEKNTLTFNPGWAQDTSVLTDFEDVRDIATRLSDEGLELVQAPDPDSDGPAFAMLFDPDGNPILLDQHVPRPD